MSYGSGIKMDTIAIDVDKHQDDSFNSDKKKLSKSQWNLVLTVFFAACAFLSACSKTNDVPAQIRAQLIVDDKLITSYLAANNLTSTAKVVDSSGVSTGIYYIIDTLGTGNDLFTSATQITVGYTGTLLTTGAAFASTDSFHPSFVLGSVIRGWQLGIPKIKKGGTITLFLPSHYAYGPFPQESIGLPANAILIFKIKLYDITN
jgi:FKBP-type peptidyl-prolyl cis-trans isomerase FkpA